MLTSKKILDPDHPFFKPVWRRWATGLLPIAWGAVEFWLESPGWGLLFVAAGAYALYVLVFIGPSDSE
jgi:hypothetical protein